MRIEILVDNEEPQVFPLNKPKILLGSHESCDIPLKSGGISRKHLVIVQEDDNYFVIDQGSTNGSYINEERLVPGRRVEFTSFFPVRMGDNVLITLLSDEDAQDLGYQESSLNDAIPKKDSTSPKIKMPSQDSTRAISLKDLQAAKTEKLVKKRQETVVKRKAGPVSKVPKKDKNRMLLVQILSFGLLGAALYYQIIMREEIKPVVEEAAPRVVGQPVQAEKLPEPPKPRYSLVPQEDLIAKTQVEPLTKDLLCNSDLEKVFCDLYKAKQVRGWGAIQSVTMIVSILEGRDYYVEADQLVPPVPLAADHPQYAIETAKRLEDLKLVAGVIFLDRVIPADFDIVPYKDYNLSFVLSIRLGPDKIEHIIVAMTPDSLKAFKENFQIRHLESVKQNGAAAVYFTKQFMTVY